MGLGEAAFYYMHTREPEGFSMRPVRPATAYYYKELGEFILPDDSVRTAANPDEMLLEFMQTTYEAAADLAAWDRKGLERKFSSMSHSVSNYSF